MDSSPQDTHDGNASRSFSTSTPLARSSGSTESSPLTPYQRFSVVLPDFSLNVNLKKVLARIADGGVVSKRTTRVELGWFLSDIADHGMKLALSGGKVPAPLQQELIHLFVTQYLPVVASYEKFKDKTTSQIEKLLLRKLSQKLTVLRSGCKKTSGGKDTDVRQKGLKEFRPGVRPDRMNPLHKKKFTAQEEKARCELVKRYRESDFGEGLAVEYSGDILYCCNPHNEFTETVDYRRADIATCEWAKDKDKTLFRVGTDEILESWPLLSHMLFLAFDFDYVTNDFDAVNSAVKRFFKFMLRGLLFYSEPSSGVRRYQSNTASLKRSGVAKLTFELTYPRIMGLIRTHWDRKDDVPTSNSDDGRLLRFLPLLGVFQRFNFYPVLQWSQGVQLPKKGIVIVESKTGRKIGIADICTYALYVEGVKIITADDEFITVVIASVVAAYALDIPLPGQVLKSGDSFRDIPPAFQVLLLALFQGEDGSSGSVPMVLTTTSTWSPQAKSLLKAINEVEATVGVSVLDRSDNDECESDNGGSREPIEKPKYDDLASTSVSGRTGVDGKPSLKKKKRKAHRESPGYEEHSDSVSVGSQRSGARTGSSHRLSDRSNASTPTLSDLGLERHVSRAKTSLDSSEAGTFVRTETSAEEVFGRSSAHRTPSLCAVLPPSDRTAPTTPTFAAAALLREANTPSLRRNVLIRNSSQEAGCGDFDEYEDLESGSQPVRRERLQFDQRATQQEKSRSERAPLAQPVRQQRMAREELANQQWDSDDGDAPPTQPVRRQRLQRENPASEQDESDDENAPPTQPVRQQRLQRENPASEQNEPNDEDAPPAQPVRRRRLQPRENPVSEQDEPDDIAPPTKPTRRQRLQPRENPASEQDEPDDIAPPTKPARRQRLQPRENPASEQDEPDDIAPPTKPARRQRLQPRENPVSEQDEPDDIAPPTKPTRRQRLQPWENPASEQDEPDDIAPPTKPARRQRLQRENQASEQDEPDDEDAPPTQPVRQQRLQREQLAVDREETDSAHSSRVDQLRQGEDPSGRGPKIQSNRRVPAASESKRELLLQTKKGKGKRLSRRKKAESESDSETEDETYAPDDSDSVEFTSRSEDDLDDEQSDSEREKGDNEVLCEDSCEEREKDDKGGCDGEGDDIVYDSVEEDEDVQNSDDDAVFHAKAATALSRLDEMETIADVTAQSAANLRSPVAISETPDPAPPNTATSTAKARPAFTPSVVTRRLAALKAPDCGKPELSDDGKENEDPAESARKVQSKPRLPTHSRRKATSGCDALSNGIKALEMEDKGKGLRQKPPMDPIVTVIPATPPKVAGPATRSAMKRVSSVRKAQMDASVRSFHRAVHSQPADIDPLILAYGSDSLLAQYGCVLDEEMNEDQQPDQPSPSRSPQKKLARK